MPLECSDSPTLPIDNDDESDTDFFKKCSWLNGGGGVIPCMSPVRPGKGSSSILQFSQFQFPIYHGSQFMHKTGL